MRQHPPEFPLRRSRGASCPEAVRRFPENQPGVATGEQNGRDDLLPCGLREVQSDLLGGTPEDELASFRNIRPLIKS